MNSVLLITPSAFGYERRTTQAVESLGHRVVWLDERIGNGIVSKVLTRLRVVQKFPFLLNAHIRKIIQTAQEMKADTLLVVNPETLNGDCLATIRSALPEMRIVIYKWDSVHQKPIDDLTFEVAKKVYSFDPEDCRRDSRLTHWPLFHSHASSDSAEKPSENMQYDFAFVGSAHLRRIQLLSKLQKRIAEQGYSHYFHLVSPSRVHHIAFLALSRLYGYTGALTVTKLNYESYLQVIKQTRCVCDIEFAMQSGLTMRTIEVVFSGTPLLTTNRSLEHYDFFDKDSMHILDEDALELPPPASVRRSKNDALFDKYSIQNWARLMLTCGNGLRWQEGRWV